MIAICGELSGGGTSSAVVAARAVATGARVELVGIVPDDPAADAQLLDLARAGAGHAAVLRGPARSLEAADVDLALRYLPEVRVVVTLGLEAGALAAAARHAGWSSATMLVVNAGEAPPGGPELPEAAIVLQAPPSDPDGTFAGFVGALAARLDAGQAPADAWAATVRQLAVDPV